MEIDECPNRLYDGSSIEAVVAHSGWPATLARAGGLYDQPAAYVDAMRLLDNAMGVIERTKNDDARSHHQRPGA